MMQAWMGVAAAVAGVAMVCARGAQAQVFDQSFEQFRKAFDAKIQADTLDKAQANWNTTRTCRQARNIQTCTFNDRGFQESVLGFKRLDMVNGRFTLNLALAVEVQGGKVAKVTLVGDRGDPMNMLQFIGTATNVMQIFEPGIVAGEVGDGKHSALVRELGMIRGDADPEVGRPTVTIKPYALIKCLSLPSKVSMAVACEWSPRS